MIYMKINILKMNLLDVFLLCVVWDRVYIQAFEKAKTKIFYPTCDMYI